ncbi:MAG: hypothetical protein Q9219_001509 [cf. Caloplaca sp. 3 TL-2023]
MTSNSSSDAQYFRGKTLTPVSPVPLHVPEPSHIPVLQNQIDPVFNLMSTHIQPATIGSDMISADDATPQGSTETMQANAVAAGLNSEVIDKGSTQNGHNPDQGDKDYVLAFDQEDLAGEAVEKQHADTFPNHSSTSAAQLSAPISAHESHPPYSQHDPITSVLNQTQRPFPDSSQASPDLPKPTQEAPAVQDQHVKSAPNSPGSSDDPMQDDGVNYQALLDNLSPSTATAPSAENITSITTAASSTAPSVLRPSSAQSPIAALPLPPGLPPRPPPQEKPAIHPNYTTEEDIRSYHYPHLPNNNTQTPNVSQPNNPNKPTPSFNHPLPPNASIGSNGLPPPPLATFQQPLSQSVQQPQPSPVLPQSRQSESFAEVPDRSAVTLENNPDETPWPPELEKLYDEFTTEEAKYVAEGVWDRFPPGSRLFVGMLDESDRNAEGGIAVGLANVITDTGGLRKYQ